MFRIYVRALITNPQGQVLLIQKNAQQKIAPNKWLFPGGAIEFNELPEEALARELFEEVNFKMTSHHLLTTETRIIGETHWLGLIFKAVGDISTVLNKEPQKHQALGWFSKDQLPEGLSETEENFLLKSLRNQI